MAESNDTEPASGNDSEDEDSSPESSSEPDRADRGGERFYAASVAKVALFSLIGSWYYGFYWSYRAWTAYRRAWGYSRREFWREVHAATGYRISPFWRTVFVSTYCFCLFPAIDRECRAARIRGLAAPALLAIAYNILWLIAEAQDVWVRLAASPIWILVPAQLAVNRLNRQSTRTRSFRTTVGELLMLAFGAAFTWKIVLDGG